MRYISAYLMCVEGGNNSPSASDIKKVLSSCDIETDDSQIQNVLNAMAGKQVDQVIAEGKSKLSSMPSVSAAPAAAPAGAAASGAPAAAAKEEAKKKEESEDEEMGFGLFD